MKLRSVITHHRFHAHFMETLEALWRSESEGISESLNTTEK